MCYETHRSSMKGERQSCHKHLVLPFKMCALKEGKNMNSFELLIVWQCDQRMHRCMWKELLFKLVIPTKKSVRLLFGWVQNFLTCYQNKDSKILKHWIEIDNCLETFDKIVNDMQFRFQIFTKLWCKFNISNDLTFASFEQQDKNVDNTKHWGELFDLIDFNLLLLQFCQTSMFVDFTFASKGVLLKKWSLQIYWIHVGDARDL